MAKIPTSKLRLSSNVSKLQVGKRRAETSERRANKCSLVEDFNRIKRAIKQQETFASNTSNAATCDDASDASSSIESMDDDEMDEYYGGGDGGGGGQKDHWCDGFVNAFINPIVNVRKRHDNSVCTFLGTAAATTISSSNNNTTISSSNNNNNNNNNNSYTNELPTSDAAQLCIFDSEEDDDNDADDDASTAADKKSATSQKLTVRRLDTLRKYFTVSDLSNIPAQRMAELFRLASINECIVGMLLSTTTKQPQQKRYALQTNSLLAMFPHIASLYTITSTTDDDVYGGGGGGGGDGGKNAAEVLSILTENASKNGGGVGGVFRYIRLEYLHIGTTNVGKKSCWRGTGGGTVYNLNLQLFRHDRRTVLAYALLTSVVYALRVQQVGSIGLITCAEHYIYDYLIERTMQSYAHSIIRKYCFIEYK